MPDCRACFTYNIYSFELLGTVNLFKLVQGCFKEHEIRYCLTYVFWLSIDNSNDYHNNDNFFIERANDDNDKDNVTEEVLPICSVFASLTSGNADLMGKYG